MYVFVTWAMIEAARSESPSRSFVEKNGIETQNSYLLLGFDLVYTHTHTDMFLL